MFAGFMAIKSMNLESLAISIVKRIKNATLSKINIVFTLRLDKKLFLFCIV